MPARPPRAKPVFSSADTSFTVESQQNGLLLFERIYAASTSPTRAWETIVVWSLLCKTMDTWNRNVVVAADADLADLAGFKNEQVLRAAYERLCDVGAVRLLPRKPHHRKTTLHLSPHLVWRGNPSARAEAATAWDAGV